MGEWKTYRLSEILNLVGGGTPKTTVPEYWNGDIPWLSVVDFGNDIKRVYKTEKTITEKGLNESSTKILKKGQLIISARGTVGELAVLGRDMAFNQSCYGIYAEAFHSIQQRELMDRFTFSSFYDAKQHIEKYMHWYNCKRRHGSLGGITPMQKWAQGSFRSTDRQHFEPASVDLSRPDCVSPWDVSAKQAKRAV